MTGEPMPFDPADFAYPGTYDLGLRLVLYVFPNGRLLLWCDSCGGMTAVAELTQDCIESTARRHRDTACKRVDGL